MVADPVSAVLAVLATYAVHSTLFFALALVASRCPGLRARTAERLWRAALVGPLATAALPLALGFEPLGGRLALHAADAVVADVSRLAQSAEDAAADAGIATGEWILLLDEGAAVPTDEPAPAATTPVDLRAALSLALLGLWASGAALGIGRLVAARLSLARLLASRRTVAFGAAARALEQVARGLPRTPRLSRSAGLTVPIAFGVRRPEICLPERALDELGPRELEAVLAHELGHLVRRDPLWLAIAHATCAVCWFQPLARVTRRELARLAELEADAFAARRTGAPLALAGALTRVAGWWRPTRVPEVAHAMAGARFALAERVERLLDGRAAAAVHRGRAEWLPPAAALIAIGWCAPALVARPALAPDATSEARRAGELTPALGTSITGTPLAGAPTAPAPALDLRAELAEVRAGLDALRDDASRLAADLAARPGARDEQRELAALVRRLERLELLREELEVLHARRVTRAASPRATDVPREPAAPAADTESR